MAADDRQLHQADVQVTEIQSRSHFAAAIGLRSLLEDFASEIPDYALDMHTINGKAMGRGLDHFRKEAARLITRQQRGTPTRTKPIGCGRSSSRASEVRCSRGRGDQPC